MKGYNISTFGWNKGWKFFKGFVLKTTVIKSLKNGMSMMNCATPTVILQIWNLLFLIGNDFERSCQLVNSLQDCFERKKSLPVFELSLKSKENKDNYMVVRLWLNIWVRPFLNLKNKLPLLTVFVNHSCSFVLLIQKKVFKMLPSYRNKLKMFGIYLHLFL